MEADLLPRYHIVRVISYRIPGLCESPPRMSTSAPLGDSMHSRTPPSPSIQNGNDYLLTSRSGTRFLDLAGYTNTGFPKGLQQSLTGLTVGQTDTFSMWLGVLNGSCGPAGFNLCAGPVAWRGFGNGAIATHASKSSG